MGNLRRAVSNRAVHLYPQVSDPQGTHNTRPGDSRKLQDSRHSAIQADFYRVQLSAGGQIFPNERGQGRRGSETDSRLLLPPIQGGLQQAEIRLRRQCHQRAKEGQPRYGNRQHKNHGPADRVAQVSRRTGSGGIPRQVGQVPQKLLSRAAGVSKVYRSTASIVS